MIYIVLNRIVKWGFFFVANIENHCMFRFSIFLYLYVCWWSGLADLKYVENLLCVCGRVFFFLFFFAHTFQMLCVFINNPMIG